VWHNSNGTASTDLDLSLAARRLIAEEAMVKKLVLLVLLSLAACTTARLAPDESKRYCEKHTQDPECMPKK